MIEAPRLDKMILKVVAFLLPFFVLGSLFDFMLESIIVGFVVIVAWHYSQLAALITWLWHKRDIYPPRSRGAWADVFDAIYHQQRKHRKKRNELSLLIRRFRMGAESLPDAAAVFNNDRTLVWCNQLAQQMLGLKWPDDMGNRIDNFLRAPEFIQYLEAKEYDEPFEFQSPINETTILEYRIAPFEKDKWTLICRDITEFKKVEQMRKDFIANVSHELRTPLTVMKGYLEVLDGDSSPPPAVWSKAHKMMSEQSDRMDALVSQLLTLTKIENNTATFGDEIIDVPALLQTIEQEANSLSNGKHKIELDVEPINIIGDKNQLRSALSNLVFNAVRYTPEEGDIRIGWTKCKKGVEFWVQDSGEGIAPEHLSRITERFYRVDKARTRDSGGSGLGLSIVKHLISLYDAELKIKSKVGIGSRFSFVILQQYIR